VSDLGALALGPSFLSRIARWFSDSTTLCPNRKARNGMVARRHGKWAGASYCRSRCPFSWPGADNLAGVLNTGKEAVIELALLAADEVWEKTSKSPTDDGQIAFLFTVGGTGVEDFVISPMRMYRAATGGCRAGMRLRFMSSSRRRSSALRPSKALPPGKKRLR
jgi:hypothetical protein